MNVAARPADHVTTINRSAGHLWRLLGFAAFCAGFWFWRYWGLLLNSDGGGFGDMGMWVGNIVASIAFTLFVFAIGVINTCTSRNHGVLAGMFVAIALYFGVTIVETHIANRIWQQELARNQAIGDDAVERIRAYIKTHGKTPASFAEVGLIEPIEPIELKRGEATHLLEYERTGGMNFKVSFPYGWYRHFWDSEAGCWDLRD